MLTAGLYWSWGTASLPEMIWTALGMIGLLIKVPNVRFASKQLDSILAMDGKNIAGYADLIFLAQGKMRRDTMRILVSFVIISVGVGFMLTPQATRAANITPGQVILTMGFFLIELIDILQAVNDNYVANALMKEREKVIKH